MNDFDDWNQTEVLVKHLLMTQPGLIFSAASTPAGTAVRTTAVTVAGHRESLECSRTMGFAKRGS